MVCCGMLTSTTTGPAGERRGFHQYSPGLSGPVGLPVGEPLVWNDGWSIGAEPAGWLANAISAMAATTRSFDFIREAWKILALFRERVGSFEIAAEREVQIHAFAQA